MGIPKIEGPNYRVQAISSSMMSRGDLVKAILYDEPFGFATIEAGFSYSLPPSHRSRRPNNIFEYFHDMEPRHNRSSIFYLV